MRGRHGAFNSVSIPSGDRSSQRSAAAFFLNIAVQNDIPAFEAKGFLIDNCLIRRKGRIARSILFRQNDVHRVRRGNVLGALESERREVNACQQRLALPEQSGRHG